MILPSRGRYGYFADGWMAVCVGQAVSSRGTKISDAELDREILSWANQRVLAAGKRGRISSFHDPSISSGLFLVSTSSGPYKCLQHPSFLLTRK